MKTIFTLLVLSILGGIGLHTYKADILALITNDLDTTDTLSLPTVQSSNDTNLDEAEPIVIELNAVDTPKDKNNSELVGVKVGD